MSNMRFTVSSRRSVIEGIGRAVLTLLHTLSKDIILVPEFEHLVLSFHEIQIGVNRIVHLFFLSKI